jgi:molybdenum cofactor cytidylyltransferase
MVLTSPELSIAGLVPAAGASRRMGQDKRRIPWRGATVLEATIESLRQGGAAPLIVVLEPSSPCQGLPALAQTIVATNPDPSRGMLSSIREGFIWLPPTVAAVAILPGDHPFVPSWAVAELLAAYRARRPSLLVPRFNGRNAHPLIIDRSLFDEALACDDAVGLRQLISRRRSEVLAVELEIPLAHCDLDEPADLALLRDAT